MLGILAIFAITAVVATATEPPTPFHVYGWVKYSNGTEVLNPNVKITNLNTTENYTVETNASSNYYQVITSSCNVSEGDVLYFNASDDGNSINRTVTVTSGNMTEGGLFEQNLTIKVGICGDVDGSGRVDMADYFLLVDYIAEVPGREPENMWAADVDCSDRVDMADYFLLVDYIAEVPGRELNCC